MIFQVRLSKTFRRFRWICWAWIFRSGLCCGSDRDPDGRRRAGLMRDREGESGECAIAVEFVCWGLGWIFCMWCVNLFVMSPARLRFESGAAERMLRENAVVRGSARPQNRARSGACPGPAQKTGWNMREACWCSARGDIFCAGICCGICRISGMRVFEPLPGFRETWNF